MDDGSISWTRSSCLEEGLHDLIISHCVCFYRFLTPTLDLSCPDKLKKEKYLVYSGLDQCFFFFLSHLRHCVLFVRFDLGSIGI